jgi:hypothetical protein
MRTDIALERSRFGLHLAEADDGPVPLVRLADIALQLFAKATIWRGMSAPDWTLANAAELLCDLLEHEERSGRLALYRLRPGLAELVHRDPLPPYSQTWRPGQRVPAGYAWVEGASSASSWGSHARSTSAPPAPSGGSIVWRGVGPEPLRFHGLSLVDELSLRTVFSHRAELYGALDDPGDEELDASDPSRLAIDKCAADRLCAAQSWCFADASDLANAAKAFRAACRPPEGFKKGDKWRDCDLEALLNQRDRLTDAGYTPMQAMVDLHLGWGYKYSGGGCLWRNLKKAEKLRLEKAGACAHRKRA